MALRSFVKANCKPFYCIWYGVRKDTWRKTRYCSSALMGIVCAWLMGKCILKSFFVSKTFENVALLLTIPVVASGFLLTDAIKCITLMSFVCLFGKSGRNYLRALSFAFIISGPVENLSANTGEIVRSFSCSKVLAINLTRTRFDLMVKPFQKTLFHVREEIRNIQNTFNYLRNVTKELHDEVLLEDVDESSNIFSTEKAIPLLRRNTQVDEQPSAQFIENRYKNKFRKRCIKQLENGKVRCSEAFHNALQKCHDELPFILKTLICWPFRVDFICEFNVFGNPEKICNPSEAIPDNFGETYVELLATENELYEKSSNVKVNYTILSSESIAGVKSAEDTAKNIAKEFNIRKGIFDSVLRILQQFLGLMALKIVYDCVIYHDMYVRKLDHDNFYVSDYFKKVDRRRISLNQPSLLPLQEYERRNLVDQSWHRTHEESQAITFHILQFALEIVTSCFFLFLDYVVATALLIIRNNAQMRFVQEGEHIIRFKVQGTGVIARLLRNTMRYFNMHETVSTFASNEKCLPIPRKLPKSFYFKLAAVYISVLLLIYQSSSFLRLRRLICGYFYRKQEKRRILYLYNSLLKQRRTVRETMMKEAKYNFANRQVRARANFFLILRLKWPKYFNWLSVFQMGRRKCVICGKLEDLKFVFCRNEACEVSYCSECFNDIGTKCWICHDLLSVEILLNFNDFFETFSFV